MSGSVSLVNGHIDPDKKRITDKQIIQALNTATNVDGLQICCIDYENNPKNVIYLSIKSDILDLINRQQAEIERLNVDLVGMRGACNSYKMHYDNAKAEIKRLTQFAELGNMRANDYRAMRDKLKAANEEIEELKKVVIDDYASEYDSKIRAEAIKEFAERLKTEFSQYQREYRNVLNDEGACAMIIAKKGVDNLVKEMVGEQE